MTISLNSYIDHTLLKPEATQEAIKKLCEEALQYGFASVCIYPTWVEYASSLLKGSSVKTCSVVGFPLGANTSKTKAYETYDLIQCGAQEVDMVINIGALKSKKYELVKSDIESVVKAAQPALVKVIIETCLLTEAEKRTASILCVEAGAHFVKTSTGFSSGGATLDDIKLIRRTVGTHFGIKASGGISDKSFAIELIQAGATRIGTSKGVHLAAPLDSLNVKRT